MSGQQPRFSLGKLQRCNGYMSTRLPMLCSPCRRLNWKDYMPTRWNPGSICWMCFPGSNYSGLEHLQRFDDNLHLWVRLLKQLKIDTLAAWPQQMLPQERPLAVSQVPLDRVMDVLTQLPLLQPLHQRLRLQLLVRPPLLPLLSLRPHLP